nr:phosphatidylglycerol lysyltransferase domain-containing protein [Chitinophaga sedimenti]
MVHPAPQTPEMIGRLKEISDEWLKRYEIEEQVFSQGMFSAAELEKQDVITLQDADGHVTAFLNIVPDYAEDEITYDMIRKRTMRRLPPWMH